MPRIKFEEYAQNVESCRQELYNHCIQNGKVVDKNASLNDLIQINNQIKTAEADNIYKVEWIDIDGSTFKAIDYIEKDKPLTIPDIIPNYDSENLEFVRWGFNCNPNKITHNTKCIPTYQCKEITEGIRPTILKLCVNTDTAYTYSITFSSYSISYNSSGAPSGSSNYGLDPIYIDWGDGSDIDTVTGSSNTSTKCTGTHTYDSDGIFIVKIWANSVSHHYLINYDNTYGILSTSNKNTASALLSLYLGSQYYSLSYTLLYPSDNQLPNLNVIIVGTSRSVSLGRYAVRNNIKAFVIPNEVTCTSSDNGPICGPILKHYVVEWDRQTPLIRSDSAAFFDSACYNITEFYYPENTTATMFNKYQIQKTNISEAIFPLGCELFTCSENNSIAHLYIPDTVTSVSVSQCPNLETISYPRGLVQLSGQIWRDNKKLHTIELRGNTDMSNTSIWYNFGSTLTTFRLPVNYTGNLYLVGAYNLSDESLKSLALNIKSISGYTITFAKRLKVKLGLLYINDEDLLTYILNKGWTVSFA